MKEELIVQFQEQINFEFASAYLYLDIANYYTAENLDGFANWFNVQAQEELAHAMLFVKYLQNNGVVVTLKDIKIEGNEYEGYKSALELALNHEKKITASINNIYECAFGTKDFRTTQFLDWFVKEQGEEEKNTEQLVKKFELFGTDGKGLYLLDTELAARVFVPPSLVI